MDFHSLTRKELQSLCKQNKIPANMTNVAMADALKALDKVEGLYEFMNEARSDPQQSPDRTVNAEPRTAVRTSTRRKPINVEPESSQVMTRTRRTTRRTTVEEAERENKNANVLETPAVPTSRRKEPVASARRKIYTQLMESGEDETPVGEEKSNEPPVTPAIRSSHGKQMEGCNDGKSAQRAYGTRRSIRLLEKSLADLSLKEERAVEVIKIQGLCEETELIEKEEVPGRDSEIDRSLENEGEMKHEVQEENNANFHEVTNNVKVEIGSESCTYLESHSGFYSEDKDDDDGSGESPLQAEISEKSIDTADGSTHENGSQTVTAALEPEAEKELINNQDSLIEQVSDDSPPAVKETENVSIVNAANEVSVEVIGLPTPKVSEAESALSSDHSLIEEVSDNNSPAVSDSKNDFIVKTAEEVYVQVIDLPTPKVSEVESEVSVGVMDLTETVGATSEVKLMEDEQHGSDYVHSQAAIGEDSDEIVTEEESDDCETDESEEIGEDSDEIVIEEDSDESGTNDIEEIGEDSDENFIEEELDGCETNDSAEMIQNEKSEIRGEFLQDKNCRETSDHLEKECNTSSPRSVKHIHSSSDSDSGVTPRSVRQNSPFVPPFLPPAEEFTVAANESIQKLEKSPCIPLVSADQVTGITVSSPFAANTIQGQFPRPTASTPRKSPSTMNRATDEKIMVADINKENIDKSGRKAEPNKEKVKKQIINDDMSIRQLKKQLKELQIAKKKNEGRIASKVETRPALQALPDNRMAAEEPLQKN